MYKAILQLESIEECMDFFEDVCTVKEVQSIAQRFAVANVVDEQRYQFLWKLIRPVVIRAVGHDNGHSVSVMECAHEVV